jgi:hypothetical protein
MSEYKNSKELREETRELERARQSLIEELAAINWYQERIDATKNDLLEVF